MGFSFGVYCRYSISVYPFSIKVSLRAHAFEDLIRVIVPAQGLRFVLVEKGCIRSVMLTAVRSQCLLAKTFMMIYAASSFINTPFALNASCLCSKSKCG